MKEKILIAFLLFSMAVHSQDPDSAKSELWKKTYRATATKINVLVNTKLDASFDFSKSWMYGKAWITLHPHFYATDSLTLDAKMMDIKEVSIVKNGKYIPLRYRYDNLKLYISLDTSYKGGENYTVYIDYVAKPDDIRSRGSAAIAGGKGLYFINPLGKDKKKPTQIWTQGETESNSGWLPTIDKPNQRQTNEISMTVPDKFTTLSNGLLVKQRKNDNGTRTDTWLMDLPHAPYLLMMVAGEYSVVRDKYKDKEVSYYVEKDYEHVARKIFGMTPEMIEYFSRLTGIDYPWQKYAQVTVRDFVSGAMENTTNTLHSEAAQQDARQLIDGNIWEDIIAHELFHQWFGDYVTCESWSNLTVNESLADFSEIMWEEYKHGKDAADEHGFNSMQNYLLSGNDKKHLVRYFYSNSEDMFDQVSYQKGGRILNMLRNYVGDSAFFKSLNLYLHTRSFNSAEAQDLRLAFEEITGQDLNWFWNQWYFGSGHPKLDIKYAYDEEKKTSTAIIKQTQQDMIFRLPVAIDVYSGKAKNRYNVLLEHQADTFSFNTSTKPDLINFDGDKILLCEKVEYKRLDEYIFQYNNAGLYLDRREAIDFAARNQCHHRDAREFLKIALGDSYHGLRLYVLQKLNLKCDSVRKSFEPVIANMSESDPESTVRATAIEALGKLNKTSYKRLFLKAINDSSYLVAGNALTALGTIDTAAAFLVAKSMSHENVKGALSVAITNILLSCSGENDFDSLAARFVMLPFGNEKFLFLLPFANFLKEVKNPFYFNKGIDMIVSFRDSLPKQYGSLIYPFLNLLILSDIASTKQSQGFTEMADYVKSKIPEKNKNVVTTEVPAEILRKYTGVYDFNGYASQIILKEGGKLFLIIPGQSEMELFPLSQSKFEIRNTDRRSVEFNVSKKKDVTGFVLYSPEGKVNAKKKK